MKYVPIVCLSALLLPISTSLAVTESDDEWLEAFDDQDTSHVNEGILVFQTDEPTEPVHHLDNQIAITSSSLETGWVSMQQCHEHIDNVSAAQIVFNKSRIRKLTVRDFNNIDSAWVEGPTVQLKDVGKAAKVCIDAETRALSEGNDGEYTLVNGPFMRRFLDGFYPMRVSMNVSLPESLKLVSVSPSPQPGFSLEEENGKVQVNTLFEGKLITELHFAVP